MEKEPLLERVSGCLLGGAIGDAMGMPMGGLSPYAVQLRFGEVDGFFAGARSSAGSTTPLTQICHSTVLAIMRGGVEHLAQARADLTSKNAPEFNWPASMRVRPDPHDKGCLPMDANPVVGAVPMGLAAAAGGWTEAELAKSVKAVVGASHASKTVQLCGFVVARMIQRCAMEPEKLADPADLYSRDSSLLSSIIDFCERAEASFRDEEAGDDRLSKRLLHAKRRLQARSTLDAFAGSNGNSEHCLESVPFSIFCFLHKCPETFDCASLAAASGRAAALNATLVGSLVGAYAGLRAIPDGLRDGVANVGGLLRMSERLVGIIHRTSPKPEQIDERTEEGPPGAP